MIRRFCLALDLVDDAVLIAEYERWHRPGNTPPEVLASIREAGIRQMEIYRIGDRMFMLIEADESYSDEAKAAADAANPHVQAWVALMKPFQRPVPAAGPDGTWIEADRVFRLTDHP
jgi:L-rhamnose mutarotase